jgi:hypothetical protein
MEHAINARAGFIGGGGIGYIGIDDHHPRIIEMTFEIQPTPDGEIIDNANLTTGCDQAIDKMAANEACASCDEIDFAQTGHNLMSTVG